MPAFGSAARPCDPTSDRANAPAPAAAARKSRRERSDMGILQIRIHRVMVRERHDTIRKLAVLRRIVSPPGLRDANLYHRLHEALRRQFFRDAAARRRQ